MCPAMSAALQAATEAANAGDDKQAVALVIAAIHGCELRIENLEQILQARHTPKLADDDT